MTIKDLLQQADQYKEQRNTLQNSISLKDTLEKQIENEHDHVAYEYMIEKALQEETTVTEELIKDFYEKLFGETATYRSIPIIIPESHLAAPDFHEIDHLMSHFINQMTTSKIMFHPIEFAIFSHKRILDIQPFKKGNRQVALLLLNFLLLKEGYPLVTLPVSLEKEYSNAIAASQENLTPNIDDIIIFLTKRIIASEKTY